MYPESLVDPIMAKIGLSILRNAHSVQCIRVKLDDPIDTIPFFRNLSSLDAWKEAFPSLRSVYLRLRSWKFDLPPQLKHVRGLEEEICWRGRGSKTQNYYLSPLSIIQNSVSKTMGSSSVE